MTTFLLDVNVLIALADSEHTSHREATRWFRQAKSRTWATCPLTEGGMVRVMASPSYQDPSLDLTDVLAVLAALRKAPGHHFWPIDFGLAEAIAPIEARFFGHQQVTDAYLLALAVRNHGTVVTFDRGLSFLAGQEFKDSVLQL